MENEEEKKLTMPAILTVFLSGACFGFLIYGLLSLTTYP